jgi:hypothetical protein
MQKCSSYSDPERLVVDSVSLVADGAARGVKAVKERHVPGHRANAVMAEFRSASRGQ